MVHEPLNQKARARRSGTAPGEHAGDHEPEEAGQPMIMQFQQAAGNQAVNDLVSGGARSLPPSIESSARSQFGVNFDNVRVHTDEEADRRTAEAGAAAMTEGTDLYFAPGVYRPDTEDGRFVIRHELAHVVQQTENRNEPMLTSQAAEMAANEAAITSGAGSGVAGQAAPGTAQLLPEDEDLPRTVSVSKTGKTIRSHAPSQPDVQRVTQGKPTAAPQPSTEVQREAEVATEAQERAVGIRQKLPESEQRRTVSVGPEETIGPGVTRRRAPSISGSTPIPERPSPVSVEDVIAHAKQIGHTFPRGMEDYYASHAEKQHIVARPDEAQGVENPMCEDCQRFMAKEAVYRKRTLTVREPGCTRVFDPDGWMTEYHADGSTVRRVPGAAGAKRSVQVFPASAGGEVPQPEGPSGAPSSGEAKQPAVALHEPEQSSGQPPEASGGSPTRTRIGRGSVPRLEAPTEGGALPSLHDRAGGFTSGEMSALAEVGGGGSAARFEAKLLRIMELVGHAMAVLDAVSTVVGAVDSVGMALRGLSGGAFVLVDELEMARGLAANSEQVLNQYREFSGEIDALDERTLWSARLDPPTAIRYSNRLRAPLPRLMAQLDSVNGSVDTTGQLVSQAVERQGRAAKVVSEPALMGVLSATAHDVEAAGAYIDLGKIIPEYRRASINFLQLRELLAKDIETLQGWSTWLSQRALEAYLRSLAPASASDGK